MSLKTDSILIHGGIDGDVTTGAVNIPVYQTSTYKQDGLGVTRGWEYSRTGNPTRDALERLIAELEHGKYGFAFASGLAAINTVLSLFKSGDKLVVSDNIYGGTFRILENVFSNFGIAYEIVNTSDLQKVEDAIDEDVKAVFIESPANPLLTVTDIEAVAKIAHEHGKLLIVDNTFLTPYLQRPLDLGADVVLHSATKYLGGHSDFTAGMIVTKTKDLSDQIYAIQNTIGAVLAPQEANLLRRGIQTLNIRMDRHIQNAEKIIAYLQSNPKVAKIYYPTVDKTSQDYQIISDEAKGAGGVLSFEVQPGLDAAKFVNSLQLIILAVSLGAAESLVEVPAFMSHFEIPKPERLKMGIQDELIRLSVVLEDADDLIADLDQAFQQI